MANHEQRANPDRTTTKEGAQYWAQDAQQSDEPARKPSRPKQTARRSKPWPYPSLGRTRPPPSDAEAFQISGNYEVEIFGAPSVFILSLKHDRDTGVTWGSYNTEEYNGVLKALSAHRTDAGVVNFQLVWRGRDWQTGTARSGHGWLNVDSNGLLIGSFMDMNVSGKRDIGSEGIESGEVARTEWIYRSYDEEIIEVDLL